MTYSLNYRIK